MADLTNLVDDSHLLPRLTAAYECAKKALEDAKGPALAYTGLWTGSDQPPFGLADGDDCGIMWVSPVGGAITAAFPLPLEQEAMNCAKMPMLEVQIGVARCLERPDFRNREIRVGEQAMFDAVRLMMSDMAAIRNGMLCCLPKMGPDGAEYQVSLGAWVPLSEQASMIGGYWTVWIG